MAVVDDVEKSSSFAGIEIDQVPVAESDPDDLVENDQLEIYSRIR